MHIVYIKGLRPDFRVFIDLLYNQNRNVDTDGNSDPVNSRHWTDLYIKDRESSDSTLEIIVNLNNSSLFEIKSETTYLEELASLYLFEYCGTSIKCDGKILSLLEIEQMKQKYLEALNRARNSIWHNSSNENPYPNLK